MKNIISVLFIFFFVKYTNTIKCTNKFCEITPELLLFTFENEISC